MYYLVVILFAVGWILLSIVRNYVATKSPISHKYLNHGIKVCLFMCLLILSFYYQKLYLSFLSLVLNIYIVLMLLKRRWFNKIKLSACTQNFFNKNLISCIYSYIKLSSNPRLANSRARLNREGICVANGGWGSSRRNYSSGVLQSNLSLAVQSIDANKDISLKYFYEWLCGITDGEGTFYIYKKNGGTFEFNYIIGLHVDDVNMLYFIKEVLGTGKVITSGNVARFSITSSPSPRGTFQPPLEAPGSIKGIEKIINIFTEYPLNTTKLLNFLAFQKAYELYTSSKSKEEVAESIIELKNTMNNKRTDFQMPTDYKPKITSYWLLGFVEGEGSFLVKKNEHKLTFTLTQSIRDFALMELIKDFLFNLLGITDAQNIDKTSIRVTTSHDSINKKPIARLTISHTGWIKYVIIPFFSNMTWRSKKELDFQDWVAIFKLKERGHLYQEEGKNVLNLIISQMNNNRLSTNKGENLPKIEREQLYLEINKLLNGPSNIEVKEEGIFIKSLNYFSTGSGKIGVHIVSNQGLILKTFTSLSDCAKTLGVTQPTARNRLIKNQPFLFENNPCYLKNIINKDSDLLESIEPQVRTSPSPTDPKDKARPAGSIDGGSSPQRGYAGRTISSYSPFYIDKKGNSNKIELNNLIKGIPKGVGKPVNIYEKWDSSGFKLIGSFVSARRAGLFLGLSGSTVLRYVQSGQVYKNKYKFSYK